MTQGQLTRRTLFATTGAAMLATPMIMTRTPALAASSADMAKMAETAAKTRSFKLGSFEITVISDGTRVSEKPNETFGLNQPAEAVSELLAANFLPTDKFVNGFSPVLVKTPTDLILFDTGLGEGGREFGAGQLLNGIADAGYKPDDVTAVVLTHMHGDHIGGLMDGGKPAFANARYVAGQAEFDFWKDPARKGTPAEGGHTGVLAKVVPLADKMSFVADGSSVASGITAKAAFGHSPGHMVYLMESDGKQLVLTGDTANHFVLSLQRPDWEVKFDMDKAAAAATRKSVFDMLATDRLPFIGYHMPFPAAGFVEKLDTGYRFVPMAYQLDL